MLPEHPTSAPSELPLLHRLEDAAPRLAVSLSTVKRLVYNGLLPSVQIGSARRVTAAALEQFVRDLADGTVSVEPRRPGRRPVDTSAAGPRAKS